MKKYILLSAALTVLAVSVLVVVTLPSLPEEAEGNKWELRKTLLYYRYIDADKEKYEAARFLIDNMKYHKSKGSLTDIPEEMETWRKETDSIYEAVRFSGMETKDWKDSLSHIRKRRIKDSEDSVTHEASVDNREFDDIKNISFRFLRDHIDNAFASWKESVFARNLSFDEFKEYILPYRSVEDYGFHETGKLWKEWFGKYLPVTGILSLRETIERYNQAVNNMRSLNGKSKREIPAGGYDLYAGGTHDCVDIAFWGCNILRACGLPVMVEYNISYKSLPGRHYHCSVWNDSKNKWENFSPESSLPGNKRKAMKETTHIYRMMYGAQKDSPYFLKNKDEFVPAILDDPCMKDVTSYLKETTSLTLPFDSLTDNKLAYLATFQKESDGLIPVTWGRIDHQNKSVTFGNAVPGILYFPVYYDSEAEVRCFGDPFYLKKKGKEFRILSVDGINPSDGNKETLVLTRKYPRKPNMVTIADKLVGGVFLGANKKDFSDAVVLYEIKEAPIPHFLEYDFDRTGKFRYYCFQASKTYPHADISMLEWIASSSYNYPNAMKPQRPDILSPEDTLKLKKENRWVKILDSPWEKMSKKSAYDGNMQTAPGAYPDITLRLKQPQTVSKVRFSPKNADNGIHEGNLYRLYYWDKGWKLAGESQADYEYVIFHDVPSDRLYWLENITSGKEEMPFIIEDGRQKFIYGDII